MVLLNTGSTIFKGGANSNIIFYSKQWQQGYFVIKKKNIQNTIYCHVVEEIGLPFSLACSVKFTPSLFLCRSSGNEADKDT